MSNQEKKEYQEREKQRQVEQNKEQARKLLETLRQQLRASQVLRVDTARSY